MPTAPAQIAGTLSYGHQRLLEVAMGLALKPRLLILDEPTQGLSDGEIDNFIGLVREIAQRRHGAADRAQHAGGDGTRRPHHGHERAAASWPRARPRRSAPTPPCSAPISERPRTRPMLTRSRSPGSTASTARRRCSTGSTCRCGEGEVLCLLGRNGAGKTTTLKAIMGLVPARARFDHARTAST